MFNTLPFDEIEARKTPLIKVSIHTCIIHTENLILWIYYYLMDTNFCGYDGCNNYKYSKGLYAEYGKTMKMENNKNK